MALMPEDEAYFQPIRSAQFRTSRYPGFGTPAGGLSTTGNVEPEPATGGLSSQSFAPPGGGGEGSVEGGQFGEQEQEGTWGNIGRAAMNVASFATNPGMAFGSLVGQMVANDVTTRSGRTAPDVTSLGRGALANSVATAAGFGSEPADATASYGGFSEGDYGGVSDDYGYDEGGLSGAMAGDNPGDGMGGMGGEGGSSGGSSGSSGGNEAGAAAGAGGDPSAGQGEGDDGGAGAAGGDACYITTAVCAAHGWPDDCRPLQLLRTFRDGVMLADPALAGDVATYYRTAPAIVARIDAGPDPRAVYAGIWRRRLRPALAAIAAGNSARAYRVYRKMVEELGESNPHSG